MNNANDNVNLLKFHRLNRFAYFYPLVAVVVALRGRIIVYANLHHIT